MKFRGFVLRAACLAVSIVMTGCGGDPPPQPVLKFVACRLEVLEKFPVIVTPSNEILIQGTLDGHQVVFKIDTGAEFSLLYGPALDELGISYSKESFLGYGEGFGGMFSIGDVKLKSLTLGDISVTTKHLPVSIPSKESEKRDDPKSKLKPGEIVEAGVIGNDYLSQYDLEFDLADDSVLLISPDHCPGHVQHWPGILLATPFKMDDLQHADAASELDEAYKIRVPIAVSGTVFTAWLDSGASWNYMPWHNASILGFSDNSPGMIKSESYPGIDGHLVEIYRYALPQVTIGEETMKDFPVRIGDPSFRTTLESKHIFLLGAEFLRANRVYIAYRERMIYFTPYKFKYAVGATPNY